MSAVFRARLYHRRWRVPAALLFALSRGMLPVLLVLVVLATDPPIELPQLLRLLTATVLGPALLARLMRPAAAVELGTGELVLRRSDLVVTVPYSAIAGLTAWAVPLPGPGLTLRRRTAAPLPYALEIADPAALLRALAHLVDEPARAALSHPTVIYAQAASAMPAWRWPHYAWKFAVFGLAPALVFFNAHQNIAYGGTLGEYYLYGAVAYARTFAVYWLTMVIYLMLFAGLWRALAEAVALIIAWAAPSHAVAVRVVVERCCQILYYAGVPALVGLRFLS